MIINEKENSQKPLQVITVFSTTHLFFTRVLSPPELFKSEISTPYKLTPRFLLGGTHHALPRKITLFFI